MKTTYIGLCLTLLIYNFAYSIASQNNPEEQLHIILNLNKQAGQTTEYPAALPQQRQAGEEGIAQNSSNDGLKRTLFTVVALGAIVSFLVSVGPTATAIKNDGVCHATLTTYIPSLLVYIGTIGACCVALNNLDRIDHEQKKIEQLKAMLAALQTKTPSSPETNATPEEVGS